MCYHLRLLLLALLLAAAAAGADELCLTGNARQQQNLAVKYQLEPTNAAPLLDGSELDGKSAGLQDMTVVLSFTESVRVTRVAVVVYNDPQRSYNAAGRMQARALRGEAEVELSPEVSLDGDAYLTCGQDGALILGSRAEARLPGAAAVDRLEVRLAKKPGAHQMLVRELYVWGLPERLATAAAAPGWPLKASVTVNTYSSLRAAWGALPPAYEYVRVRVRARGERQWQTRCFTASPAVVLWLRPDTTYETTVEAVAEAPGRAARTEAARLRLPHPLEVRTMGDIFGMNYYPGGGGAHQARPNEAENDRAMLELLKRAGVRHVRWWPAAPGAAELLAEQGMTLLPAATYEDPERYRWLAEHCGVWLTQTTNEPDFSNVFAEEYVKQFVPRHAAAQRFSPLMCLAGPAIGGEMVGPGADYLTACYAAGLKQAVDAVDTHPYGKYATPAPPGAIIGGPEGLLSSLAATREAMRAAGDAARPLIASETGHPTYEGRWFMPPSSYGQQAQWIVRTNLLFAASGLHRVIWYAFQDEGTDRTNPEHCFGIVDWYGKPKPAFETYSTMTRLLGEAKCEGLQAGVRPPVYGVRCLLPQQAQRRRYVTALWDSGGSSIVRLKAGGLRGVLSITGQPLPVPPTSAGALELPVDESVRYVYSDQPLTVLGQRRLAPPVLPQVQMTLTPTTVTVEPGQPAQWTARLVNEFEQPVAVEVQCPNPWGLAETRQTVTVPAKGSSTVAVGLATPPAPPAHKIHSWDTRCSYEQPGGVRVSFCRALFFVVP